MRQSDGNSEIDYLVDGPLMKRIFAYTTSLAATLISGCMYVPDEEVFTDIALPDPVATIALSNYNDGDTIVLYTAADFSFNVGINKGNIKQVSVLLSGKTLYDGSGPGGLFHIRDENLKTGLFELKIEFISSAGSGSLLDKLGGEVFSVWRQWIVKIDVDPPPAPILEIGSNTEFLTLSWQPYLKDNFVSYEFVSFRGSRHIVIEDRHVTSWTDSTFLWGQAAYLVTVNTLLHSQASQEVVARYPQELQFDYRAEDSTANFTWRKSHFYGAFKEVEILEDDSTRLKINTPTDTTVRLKLKDVIMGRRMKLNFHLRAKYHNEDFSDQYNLHDPLGLIKFENPIAMYFNLGIDKLIGFDQRLGDLDVYDSEPSLVASAGPVRGNFIIP